MALIYAKTVTDNMLVLGNREGYLRKFDFGTNWNVIRVLAFISGVNNTAGENTASASETVALTTTADRIFFGIKNSDNSNLPGTADSCFLGATTPTGVASECNGSAFQQSGGTLLAAGGWQDTTLVGGTTGQNLSYAMSYPTVTGSSTYNGWFGLQFTIANRGGTATQTMNILAERSDSVSGTDYSASKLLTLANAAGWAGTSRTLNWYGGGVAYDIPDAVFIRVPFYNNRCRISAIRVVKVS
jgi:hypothetical protein